MSGFLLLTFCSLMTMIMSRLIPVSLFVSLDTAGRRFLLNDTTFIRTLYIYMGMKNKMIKIYLYQTCEWVSELHIFFAGHLSFAHRPRATLTSSTASSALPWIYESASWSVRISTNGSGIDWRGFDPNSTLDAIAAVLYIAPSQPTQPHPQIEDRKGFPTGP